MSSMRLGVFDLLDLYSARAAWEHFVYHKDCSVFNSLMSLREENAAINHVHTSFATPFSELTFGLALIQLVRG